MKKQQMIHALMLFLAAAIWGFAFTAQSVGLDYVDPFTFNGTRMMLAGIVVLPMAIVAQRKQKAIAAMVDRAEDRDNRSHARGQRKKLLAGGVVCGLCLFTASSLQQAGLMYTTPGKAGFLTACYIVLVPIIGTLFLKKKNSGFIWLGVMLAVAGLYMLCINGSFRISMGDMLEILCALVFALHILSVDYFVNKVNPVALSCIQFFVCGLLSMVCMFLWETPSWNNIVAAGIPIIYAGVLSGGVGYTLQIVGQKNLNPTIASLIMSLESVFSVLGAFLLLGQKLLPREGIGCILVFAAVILAQLPSKKEKRADIQ